MSGYDKNYTIPSSLIKGRLGIYDKDFQEHNLSGVVHQESRLQQQGGNLQQERMIKDKRRSLDRAVWYSYQAAEVTKDNSNVYKALINPNKLKPDYDDKVLSIGFESEYKIGDIFKWVGTNTYWIIYLQDLTELAYFRGDIRKCSYEISWEDDNGEIKHTYAVIKGPNQNSISSLSRHEISLDMPNYTLSLILPATADTIKQFTRYNKFYLKNNNICWRVEGVDYISTPGILEVHAKEYYANESEDNIEEGIVGGLIEDIKDPNLEDNLIIGNTFIKVKKTYEYEFIGQEEQDWKVDSNSPVQLYSDGKKVKIKWDSSYSGQFNLHYGDYYKTIIVESLF